MLEGPDGHRTLIAPTAEVAAFVPSIYSFDEVVTAPVSWRKVEGGIEVIAGDLTVRLRIGGISALGVLMRLVPQSFATSPGWLRLIDPVARILVPGSGTAGSAGGGRREYYGVTLVRSITHLHAVRGGIDLGALARVDPPVRFGFGSAPATPSLVDVTTTIR